MFEKALVSPDRDAYSVSREPRTGGFHRPPPGAIHTSTKEDRKNPRLSTTTAALSILTC